MRLKIELENKSIPLLITPEGDYIHFEFKEPSTQIIELNSYEWGTIKIGFLNKESTLNFGLAKFVEIAKGLALIEKGLLFLAYKILKPYMNASLYRVLEGVFGKNKFYNLLIEAKLGDFSEENLILPDDIEKIAKEFFYESKTLYTRVVGFYYRWQDFYDFERKSSTIGKGDRVYALWEKENAYDENAVCIYHQSGKKIGYIRRTISPYLVEILKKNPVIKGEVVSSLPENYEHDERVYVKLLFN